MADLTPSTADARPDFWEWTQVALLGGSLTWTTLCLGGFRPETMVVTSALNGVLLAVHLLSRAIGSGPRVRMHPAGWWLLPFLFYGAANVLFVTPVPWLGWRDWLVWGQAVLVFWVVLNGVRSAAARRTLFGWILGLAVVAVVLAAYQRFVRPDWLMLHRVQAAQFVGRASGPFGIPNSLAAFLALLLPSLGALTCRRGASAVQRVLFGYGAAVLAFGLVLTLSRGAWLALAVTLAAWPVFATRGPLRRRLGGALLALLLIAAAGATLYTTSPAARARLEMLARERGERTRPIMWRGAWRIFRAQPVWGGGAGSYNVLFEGHRPAPYQDEPRWAHNEYLNTLADYGAVGFVLGFGAVGAIAWRTARTRPPERESDGFDERLVVSSLGLGLGAFGLQLGVDFNLKIPALAMIAAAIAALAVQARWRETRPMVQTRFDRGRCGAAAAAVLAVTFAGAVPVYRAEALRYAARQAIDGMARTRARVTDDVAVLREARQDLARAVSLDPRNGQAWADAAYAAALWAHVEPGRKTELGVEAEGRAERALAISTVVPEFWIRRGVALDLQGRGVEAGRAFVGALQLAPARAAVWYYQAYHLSLDRNDPGRARAAVDFCLRLDPANPDALTLRQRLVNRAGHP